MRRLLLVGTACFALGLGSAPSGREGQAGGPTSGKMASSWKCSAPNPVHALPVGDAANHMYVIEQFKCTATSGEIAGVKEQEGTGTEFVDAMGDNATGHGIFVDTLANGDKLHVSYELKGTSKNKILQTGTNKWRVVSGTGMFKGIKASGTCTAKGNPDGSVNFDCNGTYALAN